MYTASSLLKQTREDKGFSLDEYAKKLKIPQKYLSSFEQENPTSLPPEPYCSLYLKSYADALGLNGNNLLALFRRDHESSLSGNRLKNKLDFSLFTPEKVVALVIGICILLFSLYLINEYISFNRPPKLEVTWGEVTENQALVSGKTDDRVSVRINNDLVLVSETGEFEKKVYVSPTGNTTILVEATSPAGKTTKRDKTYSF